MEKIRDENKAMIPSKIPPTTLQYLTQEVPTIGTKE